MLSVRNVARQLIGRAAGNAEVYAAQAILRARIQGLRAVPRAGRASGVIDLQGDDQRLSFYAPPLERDSPDSLQAFRLVRMATGDLVLFSASSLSENLDLSGPGLVGWRGTKLLEGVGELSISYFGPSPDVAGGRWQRFWFDRAQPPQLIRIAAKFSGGDRRRWPDLIIRPPVTMNMACKFDTITARCSDTVAQ
jgi:hypothetical protein